ncbi:MULTISPECIES: TIR domain-containing protein [Streptosporangium]|uniref:WD40 repeat protein n=1 Tax=Streptosporangium brasiliense TaxID=47480 RepID=A0ABT9RCX1_9ACTN|nr:TIR domain-containing protein [Streptosporangium brasiliense]MDP9866721.1 WD40 repeat protein [Streptosporangium brasiliense]
MTAARGSAYDAFISYSHGHDGLLARVLQERLQRFAKPWHRMRALRVFRDQASLAANPGLWTSIEAALSSSEWLILLASPGAAGSVWVERELAWWLEHRSVRRLLLVSTGGGLAWDPGTGDWAAGAAVPPVLRGVFAEEPLWVDLSDVRSARGEAPEIPDERIAAIAAPVRGMDKDELHGEHLRSHRRNMRVAWTAVVALALAAAVAVAGGVVALDQRDQARTQARLATSRLLAAEAIASLGTRFDLAQLLAVEAYRMDRNPQTRAALFQAVSANPRLVRCLPAGAVITALAASADGNVIVAGTAAGTVVRWDLRAGTRAEIRVGDRAIGSVATSSDGRTVAAADGVRASVLEAGAGAAARPVPLESRRAAKVALSATGRYVAVLEPPPAGVLAVRDRRTGRAVRAATDSEMIGIRGESSVALVNSSGTWERRRLTDLRRIGASSDLFSPAGNYTYGISADAGHYGYVKYGGVATLATGRGTGRAGRLPDGPYDNLELSDDGRYAAASRSGRMYVLELSADVERLRPPLELTGGGSVSMIRFLGGDDRLVSATGDTLFLWDLREASRITVSTGIEVESGPTFDPPPRLAVSPEGKTVAVVGGLYTGGDVYDLSGREPRRLVHAEGLSGASVAAADSGPRVLLIGSVGAEPARSVRVWSAGPDGRQVRDIRLGPAALERPAAVRALPGGRSVAILHGGGYGVLDLTAGRPAGHGGLRPAAVADLETADISRDGTAVAWRAGDGPVVLADTRTGRTRTVGTGAAELVLFAGDRLLVQRSGGDLEVWDSSGRTRLTTLPGDAGNRPAAAVSPDGLTVARLRGDGSVQLAGLGTGDILGAFPLPPVTGGGGYPWDATALAFTADGRELLSATSGGVLARTAVDPAAWTRKACEIAGRDLSADEWRRSAHADPPPDLACDRSEQGQGL